MHEFNILTRRAFLSRNFKLSLGIALSTLMDIPLVLKRALAEGNIGLNGKKVLFIFLRGANDGVNSLIPIKDDNYAAARPNIGIPTDSLANYAATTGGCPYPTLTSPFTYTYGIPLGNGFAALHPSLMYLGPVYNAGDLALIHRVAYPKQSRSHFDSQNYWESGNPNNNLVKDGIFYRTMVASGLAGTSPLTGVSIQSALPLLLRGRAAAMTNLTDPTRYDLLGIPNTAAGNAKTDAAFRAANWYPFPDKANREMLRLQYQNLVSTLSVFSGINFTEAGNTYLDPVTGYNLFPTTSTKNQGQVDTGAYSFMTNLKAAALILNKTSAIVAGTELGGFDTHQTQGGVTGTQANLLRRVGWAIYGLRQYFRNYADQAAWENVVVVTLSEFGRTSVQNGSSGTDHAEAGVMFVAGGGIKGYGKGNTYGVFNCGLSDPIAWVPSPRDTNPNLCGTLWGAAPTVVQGYLKRCTDYRSVLGEIIRKHLGATQNQLNWIIPGYANAGECLLAGGPSATDGTPITGEVGIL
jgi:uncharacterized protein (DUF1501 family)